MTFSRSNKLGKIHTFRQLAHIDYMGKLFFFVLILFILLVVLFFPIYLETSAHYDMNRRKLTLALYLYKLLPIFGGYLATYPGGMAFHVSDKKAIIIPYSQVHAERKRFSMWRSFHLKSLFLTIETGAEYLLPAFAVHSIARSLFEMKHGNRPHKNVLWLHQGDMLRISLQFTVYFNLFMLLRYVYKVLKEKIKGLCRKKKKNSIV